MNPAGEFDRKRQVFGLSGSVGNHDRKILDENRVFSTA